MLTICRAENGCYTEVVQCYRVFKNQDTATVWSENGGLQVSEGWWHVYHESGKILMVIEVAQNGKATFKTAREA